MKDSNVNNLSNGNGSEKKVFKIKFFFIIILKLLITFFIMMGIAVVSTGVVVGIYITSLFGDKVDFDLMASKLRLTSFIYVNDENGNPREYQKIYDTENRIWVDFKDIPNIMKNAVIAIEDKRFYEHKGVDFIRTCGAALNLTSGNDSYGGSTLTQQLIKNLTEDNEVSINRKCREIFRALNFEKEYSKDEILETYLNVVNFGNGTRGVQAAADTYFNKPIQDCTIAECAAIAGITKNPSAYNPFFYPNNNKKRRNNIIQEMYDQGMISHDEYNSAMEESENLKFSIKSSSDEEEEVTASNSLRNWYVEALLSDLKRDLSQKMGVGDSAAERILYTQGLKIYSAMDENAQMIAEESLKDNAVMPRDKSIELGYVMMDLDGRILASIGSRKPKQGNLWFDRANVARRQPGSTIKPLAVYAPMIDCGMYNYSSIIPDRPVLDNWPVNWYGKYYGTISLPKAIEISANAPVAQLLAIYTPERSYEFLTKKLGFTSLDIKDSQSLAPLSAGGTHIGVTVRDMTAAFQIFGNGGKYNKPYTYFYVTDRNGNIILDNRHNKPVQAIKSETATIMNRLLRNVVIGSRGTGRGANIPDWDVIGKTGTTNDDFDSWFIGVTPYTSSGIWIGYNTPRRIYETGSAIRIWRSIMSKYLSSKEKKDFAFDPNVVAANYCPATGKLSSAGCGAQIGYYDKNNLPEVCNGAHFGGFVDAFQSSSSNSSSSSSHSSSNSNSSSSNSFTTSHSSSSNSSSSNRHSNVLESASSSNNENQEKPKKKKKKHKKKKQKKEEEIIQEE